MPQQSYCEPSMPSRFGPGIAARSHQSPEVSTAGPSSRCGLPFRHGYHPRIPQGWPRRILQLQGLRDPSRLHVHPGPHRAHETEGIPPRGPPRRGRIRRGISHVQFLCLPDRAGGPSHDRGPRPGLPRGGRWVAAARGNHLVILARGPLDSARDSPQHRHAPHQGDPRAVRRHLELLAFRAHRRPHPGRHRQYGLRRGLHPGHRRLYDQDRGLERSVRGEGDGLHGNSRKPGFSGRLTALCGLHPRRPPARRRGGKPSAFYKSP
jgi:hypothetical protein